MREIDDGTLRILLGLLGFLLAGTLHRALFSRRWSPETTRQRWRSLGSWWILAAVFVLVVVLGRPAAGVASVVLCLLLMRETLELARKARLRRGGGGETFLAILLALAGPAFLVAVAYLPAPRAHPDAELGWFVLLLVLTELNDASQAWWGRTFGSHRMTPKLSPQKTWEGLTGGVVTTGLAAVFVAPLVTSYGQLNPPGDVLDLPLWLWSAGLGLLIAFASTAGDLTGSRLKRRAGVKDSGALLPGQGGILDRFDSLTVAAPVYFFVTYGLWMA